jgi:methyl-accepting chemotaxis protein
MDSNTNRALTVMDSAGQAADYATMTARHQVARSQDEVIQLASLSSNASTPLATIDSEYDGAYPFTKWAGLKPAIQPSRADLDASTATLTTAIGQFIKQGTSVDFGRLSADVQTKSSALTEHGIPALDALLGQRISQYRSQEHLVYALLSVFAVLATYLFLVTVLSIKSGISRLLAALAAAGDGDFTVDAGVDTRDEIGATSRAVGEMQSKIRSAIGAITQSAASLAGSAEELATVSTSLTDTSAHAASGATNASTAAEQVSSTMSAVAAAIEEMGSSIREIAANSSNASSVATAAADTAASTTDIVGKLHDSSSQISNVVNMITSIAEQTNLLALNATIEAAWAGDAGKGFAVVAGEVKELAHQTATATATITAEVGTIQTDTTEAVRAISELAEVIAQINETQSSIAAAVEEQTATTNEIGVNVTDAASDANEIARNVTEVAETARTNSESAEQTHSAAGELARLSGDLQELVGQFRY